MLPDNQEQWRSADASSPARVPQRSRRGGLAATVAGVALFGALIGVAADRWAVTNFAQNPLGSVIPSVTTGPRIGPIAAPEGAPPAAPAAQTTSSDPTEQAIQHVIQQGDN